MSSHCTPEIRIRELGLLRLAAQRLVGERCASPAEAVRWMACLQGQDLPGVRASVALRSRGPGGGPATLDDVHGALADGTVVRSWPMRGTLHLTPGEDLGWMVRLAAGRSDTSAATRRRQLGLTDTVVDRAWALLEEVFRQRTHLERAEIVDLWSSEGVEVSGGRGYHLLAHFCVHALLCQADSADGAHGFVRYEPWLAAHGLTRRAPDREEAIAEWLERYLRSHGPVTTTEFQRWTTLPKRDVAPALERIADRLEAVTYGGATLWMDPETPERLAAAGRSAGRVLLLPGFDEYLLGYGDRTHTLPSEHAERIVPGGNGVFRRTILHRATVIGTWTFSGTGATREIDTRPFGELTATQLSGITRAFRTFPG